ncbi:MAG: hypothetical protein MZU84_07420 [Sphingobacterium sp.]|nr:hypothetical protein [Sphingobacterium sp.]
MGNQPALFPGLMSLKLLVESVVYVSILIWADRLLKNLTRLVVFVRENALYTRQIGEAFLILFVSEVLGVPIVCRPRCSSVQAEPSS